MNTIYSPFRVRLLLHIHCMTEPFENRSAAMEEALVDLLDIGAIRPCDRLPGFETTELGKAWVDLICQTPVPVVKWVDPRLTPKEERPIVWTIQGMQYTDEYLRRSTESWAATRPLEAPQPAADVPAPPNPAGP